VICRSSNTILLSGLRIRSRRGGVVKAVPVLVTHLGKEKGAGPDHAKRIALVIRALLNAVGVHVPQSLGNALGEQLPPLLLTIGEPHLVIALLAEHGNWRSLPTSPTGRPAHFLIRSSVKIAAWLATLPQASDWISGAMCSHSSASMPDFVGYRDLISQQLDLSDSCVKDPLGPRGWWPGASR